MSLDRIPEDWPHRDHSQMIEAGGVTWHVQRFGHGPLILLVHGTAASTHSFRAIAADLSDQFEILMVDLPGHGFSGAMDLPTLPRVAHRLGVLLDKVGVAPDLAAGHSAGAAIILRMALDDHMAPKALVGLAPALLPYGGKAEGLASQFAKLAFLNPITPRLFAHRATPERVARLIGKTGSHLAKADAIYYAQLMQRETHIKGALRLMAHWKLRPLLEDLPKLKLPLTLVVGDLDRATSPKDVESAACFVPDCDVTHLTDLGHLAHEEDPASVVSILKTVAKQVGLAGSADIPKQKAEAC